MFKRISYWDESTFSNLDRIMLMLCCYVCWLSSSDCIFMFKPFISELTLATEDTDFGLSDSSSSDSASKISFRRTSSLVSSYSSYTYVFVIFFFSSKYCFFVEVYSSSCILGDWSSSVTINSILRGEF